MSFEQAAAELGEAIKADEAPATLEQSTTPASTPEGETPAPEVQPHHAQTQPRDPASGKFILPDGSLSDTPTPAVEDTFDSGKFNPDTLAPELQPGWKQLQAEYTRKTQELAEQRRQYEQFGDPNEVAQATQLFRSLQDPTYLRQFHAELTTALEKQGLSRADASAEAARQTEAAAAGTDLSALANDQELAPVVKELSDLRAQLDAIDGERRAEREAQQLANWQMAVAGELQRKENVILTEHPEYNTPDPVTGDTPMDAIYELAAFHDGDLLAAKARYEAITSRAVEAYVTKKSSVVPGSDIAGGDGAISTQPMTPKTFDEADAAMEEYLRQNNITDLG